MMTFILGNYDEHLVLYYQIYLLGDNGVYLLLGMGDASGTPALPAQLLL